MLEPLMKDLVPQTLMILWQLVSLRQVGSVQKYLDKFDELHNSVDLPDAHALSCFLAGLKIEISVMVRMLKPKNLQEAIGLAKLQEQNLSCNPKPHPSNFNPNHKTPPKPHQTYSPQRPVNHSNFSPIPKSNPPNYSRSPSSPPILPSKRLSSQDFDEKRAKGICFWYDEKFTPGHNCRKKRQLYFMQLPEENMEEEEETVEEVEEENSPQEEVEVFTPSQPIQSHLTLHAMMGIHSFKTMMLTGSAMGKPIHVLIDSGSTHNFLDYDYARRIGCKLEPTAPFNVDIAGNLRLVSKYECKKFTWRMQGVQFNIDIMVLTLGGCDMVLGIQWLVTLGDITWNFSELKMVIPNGNKKVTLRGLQPNSVKVISGKQANKLLQTPSDIALACLGSISEFKSEDASEQGNHGASLLSLEAQIFGPGEILLQSF